MKYQVSEVDIYLNKYGWGAIEKDDNYGGRWVYKHTYRNRLRSPVEIIVFRLKDNNIVNITIRIPERYGDTLLMSTTFSYIKKINLNEVIAERLFDKLL